MISRERVVHALYIEECDRVPIGEELIWGPTLERVFGRVPVQGNSGLRMKMLASGKRDELVNKEKQDIIDLIRKLKLDIYMVFPNPPKDYVKPVETDKDKWILKDEDSKIQSIVVHRPSSGMTSQIETTINSVEAFKEYVRTREQEEVSVDPTAFEVLEYVVRKLGDKLFITSMVGGALPGVGTPWFPILLKCFYTDPGYVKRLLNIETKWAIEIGKALIDAGAEGIADGTDYAGRDGPFLSPKFFREFCLPELKKQTKAFHKRGAFTIQDTDGNIWPIAEDLLIEGGFDVYFAIEPRAGMEIAEVKRAFGDRICLWGNVDDAYTLPFGDEKSVIKETVNCINTAAPGGGYILASSCTIHKGVKPENFFTMLRTGRKYGKYPKIRMRL